MGSFDKLMIVLVRDSDLSILKHSIYNKLWKILKEMGIPDHLSCLLKNLYAATVTTGHGKTDWFLIGKKYVKAVYCHPLF